MRSATPEAWASGFLSGVEDVAHVVDESVNGVGCGLGHVDPSQYSDAILFIVMGNRAVCQLAILGGKSPLVK